MDSFDGPTGKMQEWTKWWCEKNKALFAFLPPEDQQGVTKLAENIQVIKPFNLSFKLSDRLARLLEHGSLSMKFPSLHFITEANKYLESIFPEYQQEVELYVLFS